MDVPLHLRHIGPSQILQGGKTGVQGWCDLVHPLVGALGRQTHGEQQLIVLFIVQRADPIGVERLQGVHDAPNRFLCFHLIHLSGRDSAHDGRRRANKPIHS